MTAMRKLSRWKILLFLLVAMGCHLAFPIDLAKVFSENNQIAERAVVVAPLERISLNQNARYLREVDAAADFSAAPRVDDWQNNASYSVLNFGFTQDIYWVHLPLSIRNDNTQSLLLVIPYPLLEHVELLAFDAQGKQILTTDLSQERASKRFDDFQNLLFPLPAEMIGNVDLYLRVKSTTSMQIPLEMWSETYMVKRHAHGMLWWGLYFGVLVALIFYNGFLYFSVRDITYCYYSLYLVASVGVMLCLSGLGSSYLWPADAAFNRNALTFFTGMMSLLLMAFARSFLNWKGFPRALDRILMLGVFFCMGLIVFAWFNPVMGANLSAWTGTITITLALLAGFYALRLGLVIARFFVLAFAMFAAGASIYLLNVFGVLPVSPLTNHSIQLGSALEAVLLSLALAHRIKEDRLAAMRAMQQQHETEQQLKQMELDTLDSAMHDPLTKMPNDSLLLARLQEWVRPGTESAAFGLVMLQFPQVREVGSSLGQATAEPLFCELVRSLNVLLSTSGQALCIEEKTRAHLVVIEFGLVAFLCQTPKNVEDTRMFVEKIRANYDNTFDVGNISINLDTFCGIAHYPAHGDRADILLQHANASLEEAHRNGHRVCVYSTGIDAYGQRRLALMGALSRALKQAELEIYAQPQIECGSMALVGAEILLRWHHARMGTVPTQEFIEIAENAGMMKHLTRYVVSRGMLFLKQLHQRGLKVTVSVNLSIQNLVETDFVQYVVDSSRALGIDLRYLVLEVTETSASENLDKVIDNLNRLAQAGCSIALDDFGTGYSSLAYLSRLPIHELKIDRSFISRMTESDSHLRIVENTVTLARTLKIQTVAEGVEDDKMLAAVSQLGCDRVQGYLLGKPMPTSSFAEWALGRHAS